MRGMRGIARHRTETCSSLTLHVLYLETGGRQNVDLHKIALLRCPLRTQVTVEVEAE